MILLVRYTRLLNPRTCRQLLTVEDKGLSDFADLSTLVAYPLNDMVVDRLGRAYIGNLGYDFGEFQATPQLGPILLVTPEGRGQIVAEGLAFPNGMVITPDGQTLIVAESHGACLTGFTIEPDGSLSQQRPWAQFENPSGLEEDVITPDGICLDAEGAIWVASPNTRDVLRVREHAEITARVRLENIPLACMLGGADRLTLFICTTESLNPGDTQAKGRIETLQVDIPSAGMP